MLRFHRAMLVFRKDWREVSRNWEILLPPVFFVLLPVLVILIPSLAAIPGSLLGGLEIMIQNLPKHVQDELAGMTEQQVLLYIMALYFFAPFFLIIPLMASSVIASDSFAGEKERKTIEALLATPLSDSELFLGKIMVSFIPSMLVTFASFTAYTIVINVLSFNTLNGRLLLPNLLWIMLIFGLTPTVALASIGLTVLISARVKGFREAEQINAILLIPIIILVFGQVTGALIFGPLVVGALIGIFALFDFLTFYVRVKIFKREEILSKLT